MSMRTAIVEALTTAGYNVTDSYQHSWNDCDITINNGEDYFNFSLYDGILVWHDFTHTTTIAPINQPDELVRVFKELEPLRNEELAEWIANRPFDMEACR